MTEDNGHPRLTELEIAEGLKHSFGSVQGAFLLMQEAKPTSELGEFIKERERLELRSDIYEYSRCRVIELR